MNGFHIGVYEKFIFDFNVNPFQVCTLISTKKPQVNRHKWCEMNTVEEPVSSRSDDPSQQGQSSINK